MSVMFQITIWIQDCFEGYFVIAPRPKEFVHKATYYAM